MTTKKNSERAMSLLDELKSIFTGSPKKKASNTKPRKAAANAPKKKAKKRTASRR